MRRGKDRLTRQKLENSIGRALTEMGLNGHIVATVDIHSEVGVLSCSIISLPSGAEQVYIDLRAIEDDDLIVHEIKRQLADRRRETLSLLKTQD